MKPSLIGEGGPTPEKVFVAKDVLTAALTGWLLAILMILVGTNLSNGQLALANDDAMRLVQVRDLIAGQSWFDLTQTRLGLEGGTFMHWSRLVDAPIAAIIVSLSWLLGQPAAEMVAMTLWPLLLIGPLMLAMAAAAYALGGRSAAIFTCIVCASAVQYYEKFSPGSLDHHNVQMAILAVAVSGIVLFAHGARFAAFSGAAVATSIVVGVEFIPQMALVCLAVAFYWGLQGYGTRSSMLAFSLTLVVSLVVLFAATAPAEAYRGGFCDALSRDLAIPVLTGAGGLAILSATLSSARRPVRFMALGAVLVLLGIETVFAAPACLTHPYNELDPQMRELFLPYISEVRPLYEYVVESQSFLAAAALGIVSPLIAFYMGFKGQDRESWFFLAAMNALCFAMALYQIRGVPALAVVGVLPPAIIVTKLFAYSRQNAQLKPGLAGIALAIFIVPHVWYAGRLAATRGGEQEQSAAGDLRSCLGEGSFDTLAALPPGLISAGPNLGAHILRYTSHRVLSAPYHRNQKGWSAQIEISLADEAEAERRLRTLGVDYVVSCPQDPEFRRSPEDSDFVADLKLGKIPRFLERIGADNPGPIEVYRLRPNS